MGYVLLFTVTFIDFRKTFDSIHRGKMLHILRAYGIPDMLVNAIADTYTDTKAKVLSPDGVTDVFDITASVLQGDTLAPFLFIIVLDYALRKAINGREKELGLQTKQRKSRRCPTTYITDLDFADDICEEIQQAQALLQRVEEASASVSHRWFAVGGTPRLQVLGLNDEQHRG